MTISLGKPHGATRLCIIVGILGILAFPGAASIRKSGLTGAAFLKIGVGARAVALGSAYTTVTRDANQMFWNPAGIAIDGGKSQIALSYNRWIADLNHFAAAATRDFGNLGTLGIGLVGLGLAGVDNTDGADRDAIPPVLEQSYTGFRDTQTGNYDYQDLALQISWARGFTDRLTLGATAKVISQNIDAISATATAVDFGAIYRVGYRGTRIGARINNLGDDLKFFKVAVPLPLLFSIGSAVDLVDNSQGLKVTLLADATKPQDSEQLLFTAAEAEYRNFLRLRGGYKFNYSNEKDEKVDEVTGARFSAPRTEEGFTLGLGLLLPYGGYDAVVDYAFTEFGILDNVHQISLQFEF
jgi:hypothetical protein